MCEWRRKAAGRDRGTEAAGGGVDAGDPLPDAEDY